MANLPVSYLNKIQDLRKELHQYPEYSGKERKTAASFLTITYCRLGHFVFGTSPEQTELAATLRSERNHDIGKIKQINR